MVSRTDFTILLTRFDLDEVFLIHRDEIWLFDRDKAFQWNEIWILCVIHGRFSSLAAHQAEHISSKIIHACCFSEKQLVTVFDVFGQMDINNSARLKIPKTMKSIYLLVNQSLFKSKKVCMFSLITSLTAI